MKNKTLIVLVSLVVSTLLSPMTARAEEHRATFLGHPATRFAPPLVTPEDLRARFRDEKLRPDIASILQQWGWKGNLEDLHRAALAHEITEVKIPVGGRMPFMSSREGGKPICLRNVIWEGKAPISAFVFSFNSNGRSYRCITPKPCSNFFLEDLGPEPKSELSLQCRAPEQVLAGRPVEICLTVSNIGNITEPKAAIVLDLPEKAVLTSATANAAPVAGRLAWEVLNLAPNASAELCAKLTSQEPGTLSIASAATGTNGNRTQSACATKVLGVQAILLEVVDLEDPVEVGKQITYEIKVTNQGSAPGTNIRIVCTLPASQQYVSATGITEAMVKENTITMDALAELAPKGVASWKVTAKAVKAEDSRFKVELQSDQFEKPIQEDESTELY